MTAAPVRKLLRLTGSVASQHHPRGIIPAMNLVSRQMVVVALLLATVVGLFVAAQLGERRLEGASARIALNAQRQRALAEVWQLLRQAESSQRGYILVGDVEYLAPFRRASADFGGAVERLDAAYAGARAGTRADVAQLRQLSNAKFDEMRQTVEVFGRRGREAALQIIRTDAGAATMSQIDELARKIEALDNAEAVEASHRWQVNRWSSIATTSAALVASARSTSATFVVPMSFTVSATTASTVSPAEMSAVTPRRPAVRRLSSPWARTSTRRGRW